VESANDVDGIVAVGRGQCQRESQRTTWSDETTEQLVREEAAARREDHPVVRGDVEQIGRESPTEGVVERGLVGCGQRHAAVGPQPEDDRLGDRRVSGDRGRARRVRGGAGVKSREKGILLTLVPRAA